MLFLQILEEEMNKALGGDGKPIQDELVNIRGRDILYMPTLLKLQSQADRWWNTYCSHNPSFLTSIFYGSMVTSVRCGHCNNVFHRIDLFRHL